MYGVGFRVYGVGFRVYGVGFRVYGGGSGVMIEDSEKWHKGLGSRVWDLELRVKG